MELGQIVSFNSKEKWVLIKTITKKVSGVIEEKKFMRLPSTNEEGVIYLPFTHARAAKGSIYKESSLNKIEFTCYKNCQRAKWKVYFN